jgi:glycine cleavage system H protein
VELPAVGAAFKKGAAFGSVESVKAVSELYMPVAGQVTAVNTALEAAPEKVNQTPYGDGWMIEIQPGDPAEVKGLLSRGAYLERLKGQS